VKLPLFSDPATYSKEANLNDALFVYFGWENSYPQGWPATLKCKDSCGFIWLILSLRRLNLSLVEDLRVVYLLQM